MTSLTKTIEDSIADYVEGKCSGTIRREIDVKRKQDPNFDRLIKMHEHLLSVLISTPKVAAPSILGEKILLKIQQRKIQIAKEEKQYHKESVLLLFIGIPIAFVTYMLYPHLSNKIHATVNVLLSWLNIETGTSFVMARIIHLLHEVSALMSCPIELPIITFSLPLYFLIIVGALFCFIWYLVESILIE